MSIDACMSIVSRRDSRDQFVFPARAFKKNRRRPRGGQSLPCQPCQRARSQWQWCQRAQALACSLLHGLLEPCQRARSHQWQWCRAPGCAATLSERGSSPRDRSRRRTATCVDAHGLRRFRLRHDLVRHSRRCLPAPRGARVSADSHCVDRPQHRMRLRGEASLPPGPIRDQ